MQYQWQFIWSEIYLKTHTQRPSRIRVNGHGIVEVCRQWGLYDDRHFVLSPVAVHFLYCRHVVAGRRCRQLSCAVAWPQVWRRQPYTVKVSAVDWETCSVREESTYSFFNMAVSESDRHPNVGKIPTKLLWHGIKRCVNLCEMLLFLIHLL